MPFHYVCSCLAFDADAADERKARQNAASDRITCKDVEEEEGE